MREGRVRRAWLGFGGQPLPLPRRIVRHFDLPGDSAVRVEAVEGGSPAATAGIAAGDVLVALDDLPIRDIDDLQRVLGTEAIGRALRASVVRRDRLLHLGVTPRERAPR